MAKAHNFERETLGRVVREAWVKRAIQLKDTNPDHLIPFHRLAEVDKETDRQIGEAVATVVLAQIEVDLSSLLEELDKMNGEIDAALLSKGDGFAEWRGRIDERRRRILDG